MNNNFNDLNKDILEEHFKALLALVTDSMPGVETGTEYTLKRLVGRDEWIKFPKKFRPQLGIKFSDYVKENTLPLTHGDSKLSNSNLYIKR